MIEVVGRSRLHLGLIDLAGSTGRAYGGVGMTLAAPNAVVRASLSKNFVVRAHCEVEPELGEAVTSALERLWALNPGGPRAEVSIISSAPTHVGLGSKTSTVLSALAAVSMECGLEMRRSEIVELSHRGGTSGIGIHSFFEGGLILDAGLPDRSGQIAFAPSSASDGSTTPTKLGRYPIPETWMVTLMMPCGFRLSGEAEAEFFRQHTPIGKQDALSAAGLGAFSIPAAVVDEDLVQFAVALRRLQGLGFKAVEIGKQDPAVMALLTKLWKIDAVAAGMSSMGPLVFAISEKHDKVSLQAVKSAAAMASAEIISTTPFSNSGYLAS